LQGDHCGLLAIAAKVCANLPQCTRQERTG